MMRFSLFVLFIISTTTQALAQDWKRTQNWYFGDSAGLSFATDPPTVLTDGQMYALEGSSTISDTAGNLLFYTNGQTVWNKNHQVMKNGTGLFSTESIAQPAMIIPQPENDSVYFIFTVGSKDVLSPRAIRYSIININGDSGFGEILEKNIDLALTGTEKLAATHHANGHDVWIATHDYDNNHFYSFLVTKDGVIHCPVISKVGSVMTGGANQTEMRFSPSGKLACITFWNDGFVELLQFNNQKGIFSAPIKILTSPGWVLGIIFSYDEKQLFLAARERWIRSYSLSPLHASIISNNYKTIYTGGDIHSQFAYSKENEILLNWVGRNYLGKIILSNLDTSVTFIDSAVYLGPHTGNHGMPQFPASYVYKPDINIHYQTGCENDSVYFSAKSSQALVSPEWTLYKNGNVLHSSNGVSLNYFFSDTGTYLIQLIEQGDTVNKNILIEPKPDLGPDTFYCGINEITLSVPNHLRCIQWQDGSDSTTFKVTQSGTYYVNGYDTKGCFLSDTVNIKLGNIGQPVISRSGDSLYTDTGFYAYQWYLNNNSIGVNAPFHIAKQTGNYKVEITDSIGCKSVSNTLSVNVLSVKRVDNSSIRIYPNPLTQGQELNIVSEEPIHSIQGFNSLGQLAHEKTGINVNTYKLKNLNRGIYTLIINQTVYVKIIIH